MEEEVDEEVDPDLGSVKALPCEPQSDHESDESEVDEGSDELKNANIYVGQEMPPDEDIGFSVYEYDDSGMGLANNLIVVGEDKKKKKPTKEKGPAPLLPPERLYTKYTQGHDQGFGEKNTFKRNAHGTAGSNKGF